MQYGVGEQRICLLIGAPQCIGFYAVYGQSVEQWPQHIITVVVIETIEQLFRQKHREAAVFFEFARDVLFVVFGEFFVGYARPAIPRPEPVCVYEASPVARPPMLGEYSSLPSTFLMLTGRRLDTMIVFPISLTY